MPFYVDRNGELFESNPETPQDLDTLLQQGLAPATEEDKARHNHSFDVQERADVGLLDKGGAVDAYTNAALRLTDGLGTVASDERVAEAGSDDARLTAEAHPTANALGRSVPLAPVAAGAGMLAGPFAGVGGAVLAEGAVEGTAQEYDDAWLEQRPAELQKVVTNTLLFAGTDGLFRGVLGAAARAGANETSMVVRRNIVAEAAGRAANSTRSKASQQAARDVAETIGGWVGGAVGAKAGPLGAMVGRRVGRRAGGSLFPDVAEEAVESAAAPEIVSYTSRPNPPRGVPRETVITPEPVPAPGAASQAPVPDVATDDLESQLRTSVEQARGRARPVSPPGNTPAPAPGKPKKIFGPGEGPDLEEQLRQSLGAAQAYNAALKEVGAAGSELTARRARQFLGQREPSTKGALALFAVSGKALYDVLEQKREQIDAIAADPLALTNSLAASTGDLVQTHPAVFQALAVKMYGIAGYLKSSLPPRTGQTPLNPKGYPPTQDEATDFAYRYVGATMPRQSLKDVAAGRAMPKQIEGLRANWQDLIDEFQVNIMGAIAQASERGREIPRERIRQAEDLLGIPGGLDPTMGLAMAQSFETAYAAEEAEKQSRGAQSGGGGSSPGLATSYQTHLASVAAQRTMV